MKNNEKRGAVSGHRRPSRFGAGMEIFGCAALFGLAMIFIGIFL